jgi:predicted hydrocarbon binding protein
VRAVLRAGEYDAGELKGRVPLSHYIRLRDAALDFFGQGFQKVAFETGRLLVRNIDGVRQDLVDRLLSQYAGVAQPLEPLRQVASIAAQGNPGRIGTRIDSAGTLHVIIDDCPECRRISSSAPFCSLNQGMLSEFAARYLSLSVTTKETRCMASGDESCEVEVALSAAEATRSVPARSAEDALDHDV